MTKICTLKREKAIKAIENADKVMFKSGVWNNYYLRDRAETQEYIRKSGYGADVNYDEANNMYYVCCPCAADMW